MFYHYTRERGVEQLLLQNDLDLGGDLSSGKQVEFISFDCHLIPFAVFRMHQSHDQQIPMYRCDTCITAAYADTRAAETAQAEALARVLPSLNVVEWCSYFCESGKSRFTIHRTETGNIRVEAVNEALSVS